MSAPVDTTAAAQPPGSWLDTVGALGFEAFTWRAEGDEGLAAQVQGLFDRLPPLSPTTRPASRRRSMPSWRG
jgi:hypothetical protein